MAEAFKAVWPGRRWLQALWGSVGSLCPLQHPEATSWGWCSERAHLLWPQARGFVFISAAVDHLPHHSWVGSCVGNPLIPTCLPGIQESGIEFTISGLFIKPNYNVKRNLLSETQKNQETKAWMNEQVSLYSSLLFVIDFFSLVSKQTK